MSFKISAKTRVATTKKDNNIERHKGNILGVLYFSAKGDGAIKISINGKEFQNFLSSLKENSLGITEFILDLDGSDHRVIVKGIQYGIVTYPTEILHLDFMVINDDSVVNVKVPVCLNNNLSGECPGTQQGGFVRKNIRRIGVRGKWSDIPASFIADMKLCDIGDSVYAKDVLKDHKVKLSSIAEDEAIATVDKRKGQS